MIPSQESGGWWQRMLQLGATVQCRIGTWMGEEIIDDDAPHDLWTLEEAVLRNCWRLDQE